MWDMWDNLWIYLLVYGCSTWRLSYMLVNETGPGALFVFIRTLAGIEHNDEYKPISYPDNFFASLLSCVYCTSVWVGLFTVAWGLLVPEPYATILVLPLALSAVAIVIDSIVQRG